MRVALATRSNEVQAALDEFAEAHDLQSHRDLLFYYLGGRDNNRGPIEAMSDGTGVKVFELDGFTSSQAIYNYLRDRGFGMNIPCRFRNGVPVQEVTRE